MPSSQKLSPARWAAWRRLRAQAGGLTPEAQDVGWPELQGLERRERAAAERLTRGVFQHRALLDALIRACPGIHWGRTAAKLRDVLRLAAYERIFQNQSPDYAIGAQSVALARRAAGQNASRFVNAAVHRLMENLPAGEAALKASAFFAEAPDHVRWSIPEATISLYKKAYGAGPSRDVTSALAETPPAVWLRVNTLKTTPDALAEMLTKEGCETEAIEGLPEALRWTGGERRPWETGPWERGWMTVQDIGAMLAARLLGVVPGQRILDFCAAPGGKTGHLWERMQGQGSLTAWEPSPQRRATMCEALRRLYGPDAPIAVPESPEDGAWGEPGSYDRVLVDAPCLALGLIRRHPEIRWGGRERNPAQFAERQVDILGEAARWVRPGGRLLWVTCSPTVEENEDIALTWLRGAPGWRPVSIHLLPGVIQPSWAAINKLCLRTRPDRLACDGFAMTLLERAADGPLP